MSAVRIFFGTGDGFVKQILILIWLLAASLAEGFGLATVLPVLSVATESDAGITAGIRDPDDRIAGVMGPANLF